MLFWNKFGKAGNKGLFGQTIITIIIKVLFFLLKKKSLSVLCIMGSTPILPLAKRIRILSPYK